MATSAIREATNREAFLAQARERSGLDIEVLSREAEAFYGYVAAVDSTTLTDGAVLDVGGGSMQLTRVAGRAERDVESWRMGAVRMTERFLPGERATKKQLRALTDHVKRKLGEADWLPGLGGTGRLVCPRRHGAGRSPWRRRRAADQPSFGVQGFSLERAMLDELDRRARGAAGLRAPARARDQARARPT